MKRKLFLALLALATSFSLVSCGDDSKEDDPQPQGGGDIENSAFSIKYQTGDGDYEIFTISADRQQRRLDYISIDTTWIDWETETQLTEPRISVTHTVCLNKNEGYFEYDDYSAEWEESFQAAQSCNNYYVSHQDLSKYYVRDAGFTEAGTETICGVTCKKYTGTHTSIDTRYNELYMGGVKEEIVVGNGFTFRLAYEDMNDDEAIVMKDVLKAVALTTNVPASAFTKTLDVTWIK